MAPPGWWGLGFHLWFGLFPAVRAPGVGWECQVGFQSRTGHRSGHGRGAWSQCPHQDEGMAVLSLLATAGM